MKDTSSGGRFLKKLGTCVGAILLTNGALASQAAWAQDPPPPAAPLPPPAMEMAPPPAPAPPPLPATSAIEAAPKPPTATESMPAARPDALPPIDVGAWTRVGSVFQSPSDPTSLNDFHFDNAYVELHAGGKIHKKVGVTLNLNANMNNTTGVNRPIGGGNPLVAVMDAIVSFDFTDEFHLWAGHLLVPVDRANASGPFFMIPWNYPGFIGAGGALSVGAPLEGPSGRNNGAVVWGDVLSNRLTYLVGVFDNMDVNTSPLYSGRLRLALWDTEPGFWGNCSFFGDKDILSIGVGGQYRKHGSSSMTEDKDWTDVNVDVLLEKKIPGGGWVTAEGAFYSFNVLDGGVNASYYGLLAYASPTVGVGNIQPMVRYQGNHIKNGSGTNPWNIDAGLSYLVKGPALRVLATFSHNKLPDDMLGNSVSANAVQLGAQAIFF